MIRSSLFVLLFLTGCAPTCPAPTDQQTRKLTAPIVIEYSKETQKQAAAEVRANKSPVLTEWSKDYAVMRNQSRRLIGEIKAQK